MRIYLICQYYPPEIGAPQARLSEIAKEWVQQGHDITVLTGFPNHPTGVIPSNYRGKIFLKEIVDNIRIWRHWIYATPNEGFLKKTFSHLSFMASILLWSIYRGRRPDVFIVSSPNFFSVISTYIISRLRRVPFVFEVRDLWPGIFVELGVLKSRVLIRLLEWVELFLYKRAAAVVPVTNGFAENMIKRGIPVEKIEVVTNGVDLDRFKPGPMDINFRSRLGLSENDFIVLYIGAHGISHGLRKILDAAKLLQKYSDIHFLFVGEGAVKSHLISAAKSLWLKNVTFLAGQPREKVVDFYRLADVCLVPLKDIKGFDTFIPSKMFEIMGCGRPIIAALKGESADILKKSESAIIIHPEKPNALAEAIVFLKRNPNKCIEMGRMGRDFVERNYDRRKFAFKYLSLLRCIVARNEA